MALGYGIAPGKGANGVEGYGKGADGKFGYNPEPELGYGVADGCDGIPSPGYEAFCACTVCFTTYGMPPADSDDGYGSEGYSPDFGLLFCALSSLLTSFLL